MGGDPLIELEGVSVRFGDTTALESLDFTVRRGGKHVVRGKSGSGKSTLMRLLLGFVQPSEGRVLVDGEPLQPESATRLRREVSYVNQGIDFERGPVEEVLLRPCRFAATAALPDRTDMERTLERLDLSPSLLESEISDLSGGERQRVAIASGLLRRREIFLLDEPTSALDGPLAEKVAKLFLEGPPEWTVVVVSHDEAWHRPDLAEILELSPAPVA